MSIEDNKALVRTFWTAFSEMRYDDMFDMMADDATWLVTGTTSISGTYSKEAFRQMIDGFGPLAPTGVQFTIHGLTAEEDRVAIEATSHGEFSNDKVYKNTYHLLMVLREGKVLVVKEYMDTEHVTETFG